MRKLRRALLIGLVAVLLLAPLDAVGVSADDPTNTPQSTPNGPWLQDNQNVSLSSIMTNEELYARLEHLQEVSKGKMGLEIAGYSDANPLGDLMEPVGYPLYVAKFGAADPGKARVFITSQIHGNEVLGTEAALQLMQKLIAGGNEVDEILAQASIWIMPRINPDGAAATRDGELYPIRQSLQVWDPTLYGLPAGTRAPWYYSASRQGYDQNRDYSPELDFRIEDLDPAVAASVLADTGRGHRNSSDFGGFYVTPEARIVTKVFQELQPTIYFDLHHRGFNALSDEDNRSVSIQVAADVALPHDDPLTGGHYEVDPNVLKLAKQVNATGWLALQKGDSHIGAIQKYPEVNLPGTALGAFAFNGAAIMLIEIKGQTQSLGQKQSGALIMAAREAVYGVLTAVADGSIYDVPEAIYDAIPESANSLRPPHDDLQEELEE